MKNKKNSYIFHQNAAGNLVTQRLFKYIVLDTMTTGQLLCLSVFCVFLILICGLKLRRIHCPEFEEERGKWGISTIVLFLLVLTMLCYILATVLKLSPNIDKMLKDVMRLQDNEGSIEEETLTLLAHSAYQDLDYMILLNSVSIGFLGVCAFFLNLLWAHYVLMFIPKEKILAYKQMVQPVCWFFAILFCAIWSFSLLFYAMFSDQSRYYSNPTESFISVCFFALGRVADWNVLLENEPVATFAVSLVVFGVFSVMMRWYLTAVFVSFQREAELRLQYQNHPMWPQLRNADKWGILF